MQKRRELPQIACQDIFLNWNDQLEEAGVAVQLSPIMKKDAHNPGARLKTNIDPDETLDKSAAESCCLT